MQVSIVIPTCGRPESLRLMLMALNFQEPGGDYEAIVVFDGEDVDLGEFQAHFPIRVLSTGTRKKGAAAARNLGLRHAQGRIILFLDEDIVAPQNLVATHVAWHASKRNAVLIGMRERISHEIWPHLSSGEIAKSHGVRDYRIELLSGMQWRQFPWAYFATCHASVDKSLFAHAGTFDEYFVECMLEDTELGYRLARAGAEIDWIKKPAARHLEPALHDMTLAANPLDWPISKRRSYIKNSEHFASKYPHDNLLQSLLRWHMYAAECSWDGNEISSDPPQNVFIQPSAPIPDHYSLLSSFTDIKDSTRTPLRKKGSIYET